MLQGEGSHCSPTLRTMEVIIPDSVPSTNWRREGWGAPTASWTCEVQEKSHTTHSASFWSSTVGYELDVQRTLAAYGAD
jgi:hypothetical protein